MKRTILGRTGLDVSVAGLGCGGSSRLGVSKHGLEHAANLVRTAFDNGVNFFDTANLYGTEEAVGLGLKGISRDKYVLSTKFWYRNEQDIHSPEKLTQTLDESLKTLQTDYIDIYHLHAVSPQDYDEVIDIYLPVIQDAQRQGKIRFLGITETFGGDTNHDMLIKALADDYFDVIMVGYNIINPSAAKTVLPAAMERNVGVLCMHAVRKSLSNPEQLKIDIQRILEKGQADPELLKSYGTLEFLVRNGAANSIMEAAYRFCGNTQGIHVTLTGTGNVDHLLDNLRAMQMPPLPDDIMRKLALMFSNVDCVSGE